MDDLNLDKASVTALAAFGGRPLFSTPKPVSNLPRPDFNAFLAYLKRAYDRGVLTGRGPVVQDLEKRLCQFHEVPHCVTFNSGFWALAAVMKSLALPGRDEVIMPSLTYRRMADIAGWAGLKPRFCEVNRVNMTNTAVCVQPCLTSSTALIIGVHPISGLADIDGLSQLAGEVGVPLVFDSVESVYEAHQGRRIGGFGTAEVFSLGASKLVNGFEGGYVTTCDRSVAQRLRATLRQTDAEPSTGVAFNGGLSEIHAAMALSCLDDIDNQITRNRRRYLAYKQHLKDLSGIRLLEFSEADRPGYKNIVAEITADWPLERDETIQLLNAELILARAYYPQPLHWRKMGYPHVRSELPDTDEMSRRYVLLPCGELVTEIDITRICELLKFIARNAREIRLTRTGQTS